MQQDYNQTAAYVHALTGDANSVMDWRAIYDKSNDRPAHNIRGTLADCWFQLCDYNSRDYGIFAIVNETDGRGRDVANIVAIRAHFIDLDNLSAMENLARARDWYPQPAFAVQSSPNKAHVYWPVVRYMDALRFTSIQRRLITQFNADLVIHDLPRVMRVPGFYHCKGAPVSVTCFALPGFGVRVAHDVLDVALAGVVEHTGGSGERHALGDPALAAPSVEWIKFALDNVDPNTLSRGEWIALTCAVKQSGWNLTDSGALFNLWSEWCARYDSNNPAENLKQWNSIRNTELGWQSIVRRVPAVHARLTFGDGTRLVSESGEIPASTGVADNGQVSKFGEILTPAEQSEYFNGCVFVARLGSIMNENGRMLNPSTFNALFGGKKFIIDQEGKLTDEPWKAATRSTVWTVPKVDHLRFLPHEEYRKIIVDGLGRKGVNTYKKPNVIVKQGDPSRFLNHLAVIFPVENDRKILIEYLAHNAKYPGYKIPWAPLVQSTEGTGKTIFKDLISRMFGGVYTHEPNAMELVASGSKFNAWMRAKLMIFVDEIKVDERRDMIEVLKPMISEKEIEIQSKGHDQEKEDNYANWFFASNYKDAIPINKNARRFSIFYSALQSYDDVLRAGMGGSYFPELYAWLEGDGYAIVINYLLNYPIERGAIPMRAPETSSTIEALRQSRGPIEQIIIDAVEDEIPGFKGGFISSIAAMNRIKLNHSRPFAASTLGRILESLGYVVIGRAERSYFQEDVTARATIYGVRAGMNAIDFARVQGYS